jgi:transposase
MNNTQAMQWHLEEISSQVAPGAHAVLILDQAGWHTTKKLAVPENITLLPLPPRSPELNPVENIWQFMRDNWLSNRVSSPSAARPGTGSSASRGRSCQSATENGHMSSD